MRMAISKRIAILTLSVGSGHVRTAEVIERALSDRGDKVEIRTIDVLEHSSSWFVWLYVRPYWAMLRHVPWMWRWLFERRQRKCHRSTAPHGIFRRGCEGVLSRLKTFAPQLIIVTEIGAAELAALGRREGWFNAPVLAVQTDFQTEPPWVQREIDLHCVGSEEAKAQLIGWGVSPNRILVSGIPVDPAFALPFDKAELLGAFGLDVRRPVVLVMEGGMGPAPLDKVVEVLELCGLPLQVIAVAGHDQKMRERLERLRGRVALDLHTFGWTEAVPELMAVADLLITKPGGVTTAEALAKGLPMVLTHPIPGPEERHLRYLEERGVAVAASGLEEIPGIVSRLLANRTQLEDLGRRARELARPDAVHAVAQVAHAMLEKASYIELLATPPARSSESAYLM